MAATLTNVATSTTSAALSAGAVTFGVRLSLDPDAGAIVYVNVGATATSSHYPLFAGREIELPVGALPNRDASDIRLIASTGTPVVGVAIL
jgi:hypothetical protein